MTEQTPQEARAIAKRILDNDHATAVQLTCEGETLANLTVLYLVGRSIVQVFNADHPTRHLPETDQAFLTVGRNKVAELYVLAQV